MQKRLEFGPTRRLERAYAAGIRKIIGRVLTPKLPEQSFSDWITSIAARSRAEDVQEACSLLASQMVQQNSTANSRTWKQAAAKWSGGCRLYRLLQVELNGTPLGAKVARIVRANAEYIRSIPVEAARTLTGEVTRAQQAGARPATMAKMMRARFPELLKSRVNLIARTEVAKASTALTQARSEQVGADWYEWLTSEDARVRDSHKKMNGILVAWAQPPSPERLAGEPSGLGPYHAGACPNCRCTSAPMLSIDDVDWPHKVHDGSTVKRMTRAEFERRFIRKAA